MPDDCIESNGTNEVKLANGWSYFCDIGRLLNNFKQTHVSWGGPTPHARENPRAWMARLATLRVVRLFSRTSRTIWAGHESEQAFYRPRRPVEVQPDRARIGFESKLGLGPLAFGLSYSPPPCFLLVSSHALFASPLFCALFSEVLFDTLSPQSFSLPCGLLRFAGQLLFLFSPLSLLCSSSIE